MAVGADDSLVAMFSSDSVAMQQESVYGDLESVLIKLFQHGLYSTYCSFYTLDQAYCRYTV